MPTSLKEIAALAGAHGDLLLRQEIDQKLRLVAFEGTKLTVAVEAGARAGLPGRLQKALIEWTGTTWDVEPGDPMAAEPTLKEAREKAIEEHPLVKEALKTFPGATISQIRPIGGKE
nr:hypothetical protein [Parvularcula mediterranea]